MSRAAKRDLHVRWMIRSDMPEVLEIEQLCFEFPWSEDEFIRCLRVRNCIGMVADNAVDRSESPHPRERDEILGFMVYELHKTHLDILNFAVLPKAQHRGVGKKMIDKLVGKMHPDRRTKITLKVRDSNLDACLFFKSQGFVATGIIREHYEECGDDAIVFEYRHFAEVSKASANISCPGK